MRQIGSIEELEQATRFGAYLVTQGIACTVDAAISGHVIWVHEEDQVARAKEELARFRSEPDDERYRGVKGRAESVTRQRKQQAVATRSRTINLRDRWARSTIDHGPVTFGLMALMTVVAVLTGLNPRAHEGLLIKLVFSPDGTLNAIQSGEVWRLVTPIFVHMGILHFLFNLLWLRDLGLPVEYRLGTPKFFGMALVIAVLSNAAQFVWGHGWFGGMSGVNYGLFGYVWVRARLDPESGFWIHPSTVVYMLGWYIFCVIGVIPDVANWAHTGGLVVGAAMGASKPMWRSLTGRRSA